MKNWNSLFVRQGFMVKEVKPNVLDCAGETDENMLFLIKSLKKADVIFSYETFKPLWNQKSFQKQIGFVR